MPALRRRSAVKRRCSQYGDYRNKCQGISGAAGRRPAEESASGTVRALAFGAYAPTGAQGAPRPTGSPARCFAARYSSCQAMIAMPITDTNHSTVRSQGMPIR